MPLSLADLSGLLTKYTPPRAAATPFPTIDQIGSLGAVVSKNIERARVHKEKAETLQLQQAQLNQRASADQARQQERTMHNMATEETAEQRLDFDRRDKLQEVLGEVDEQLTADTPDERELGLGRLRILGYKADTLAEGMAAIDGAQESLALGHPDHQGGPIPNVAEADRVDEVTKANDRVREQRAEQAQVDEQQLAQRTQQADAQNPFPQNEQEQRIQIEGEDYPEEEPAQEPAQGPEQARVPGQAAMQPVQAVVPPGETFPGDMGMPSAPQMPSDQQVAEQVVEQEQDMAVGQPGELTEELPPDDPPPSGYATWDNVPDSAFNEAGEYIGGAGEGTAQEALVRQEQPDFYQEGEGSETVLSYGGQEVARFSPKAIREAGKRRAKALTDAMIASARPDMLSAAYQMADVTEAAAPSMGLKDAAALGQKIWNTRTQQESAMERAEMAAAAQMSQGKLDERAARNLSRLVRDRTRTARTRKSFTDMANRLLKEKGQKKIESDQRAVLQAMKGMSGDGAEQHYAMIGIFRATGQVGVMTDKDLDLLPGYKSVFASIENWINKALEGRLGDDVVAQVKSAMAAIWIIREGEGKKNYEYLRDLRDIARGRSNGEVGQDKEGRLGNAQALKADAFDDVLVGTYKSRKWFEGEDAADKRRREGRIRDAEEKPLPSVEIGPDTDPGHSSAMEALLE